MRVYKTMHERGELEMSLEDISEDKRYEIGMNINAIKLKLQKIREFLFVVEAGEVIAERFEGASEIFDVIESWIRGDDIEYIGESIFQSDGKLITKILKLFGITY